MNLAKETNWTLTSLREREGERRLKQRPTHQAVGTRERERVGRDLLLFTCREVLLNQEVYLRISYYSTIRGIIEMVNRRREKAESQQYPPPENDVNHSM